MAAIPSHTRLDSSLALLREGYEFIGNRCRRYGSDVFETRILLQRVVCMSGSEAAEVFYGGERFTRRRAIPRPTLTLLQDFGSVQVLDGEAHRHRKAMFMELMAPEEIERLLELSGREWGAAARRWSGREEIALDGEAREVLCRVACSWAGVPLIPSEAPSRAADLAALFEGAGSFGPRQLRGQLARRRCERWARRTVRDVREGRLAPAGGTAAAAIAWHRDPAGGALAEEVAAVELLNVLRPIVAVSRFVTFAALALHDHPAWARRLREGAAGENSVVERFSQEVRRFYPFFPLVTGRATADFRWRGHRFRRGDWAMLDVYGTNRDRRSWERPGEFDPDRFLGWRGGAFDLIPQGGGDYLSGHRCAGEWIAIALVEAAVRRLARHLDYEVPPQDLTMRLSRMPAVPASRVRLRAVRPVP